MKMSTRGRKLLIEREGCILHAYRDSVGVLTVGVGHTAAAGPPIPYPGMIITAQEADAILTKDLVLYERAIDNALKVPVSQNEYDALVSICFNVGPKFGQSTCIKRLNAGDREGAAEAIMLWNKPPEIISRRRTEYKQFKTPYQGMVTKKKPPSKTTGPVVAGTAGAGAGAAAQQAGLPWWAVGLIVLGVAVAAYAIWRMKS
jgi:lysozyme